MNGSKVIGIISYLPDGELRYKRIDLLEKTLEFFHKNFPTVPIIVVAQNWLGYMAKIPCTVYSYKSKLGILEARRSLINIFIKSKYDYLIMSDDDVTATIDDTYLQQIDDNPGKVGLIENTTSLILVSFPKEVLKQIPIPYRDPYDYFEDVYIISIVKKYFDHFFFKGVNDKTRTTSGIYSTWWDNSNKVKLFQSITDYLIEEYKR